MGMVILSFSDKPLRILKKLQSKNRLSFKVETKDSSVKRTRKIKRKQ